MQAPRDWRGWAGLGRGAAPAAHTRLPVLGTHPASPLRDPPGDAVMQHEVDHEAGHLAQEASQSTLVDIQGQAVAETQESHHSAPVDATLEQAAGRAWGPSVEAPQEAPQPAFPFPPPWPPTPLPDGKQNGLGVNQSGRGCPSLAAI